jgi:hypothetical protein
MLTIPSGTKDTYIQIAKREKEKALQHRVTIKALEKAAAAADVAASKASAAASAIEAAETAALESVKLSEEIEISSMER